MTVHVKFFVPDYVPVLYRSKVTVVVKKAFTSNVTGGSSIFAF